jgi:hypothetical protein
MPLEPIHGSSTRSAARGRVERARTSARTRVLTLAVVAIAMTGCFSWQTVGALPRTADLPADSRITKFDGSVVVLATSRIENDTIRGFTPGSRTKTVIPLAHVDLIEAKRLEPKRSLIGGTITAVVLYIIYQSITSAKPFGNVPTP